MDEFQVKLGEAAFDGNVEEVVRLLGMGVDVNCVGLRGSKGIWVSGLL